MQRVQWLMRQGLLSSNLGRNELPVSTQQAGSRNVDAPDSARNELPYSLLLQTSAAQPS